MVRSLKNSILGLSFVVIVSACGNETELSTQSLPQLTNAIQEVLVEGEVTDVNTNNSTITVEDKLGKEVVQKLPEEQIKNIKEGSIIRITKRIKNSKLYIPGSGVDEITSEDISDSEIDYRD